MHTLHLFYFFVVYHAGFHNSMSQQTQLLWHECFKVFRGIPRL